MREVEANDRSAEAGSVSVFARIYSQICLKDIHEMFMIRGSKDKVNPAAFNFLTELLPL